MTPWATEADESGLESRAGLALSLTIKEES